MERNLWSREEMILVLNLYLKLPFGQMDARNPAVIELAGIMGRSANAVALRLVNYAACDPLLKKRGVAGMAHGGRKCQDIWKEFVHDRERLVFESEQILAGREKTTVEDKYKTVLSTLPSGLVGQTRVREVKTRVNQSVFRQMVLANYGGRCALTGMDLPELLVASHVIPWAKNETERLNPENGICLSSLYDAAFDKGLLSFDQSNKTIFSERLSQNVGKDYYTRHFAPVEGVQLATPGKYRLNPEFLAWHRQHVFQG